MPLVESSSGIRGIFDKDLTGQVAARYVYSYLSLLKDKKNLKIVVGTDTRPSKDILKDTVIEVLDCEIIDVGIASTPMTEFAVRHFKASGGIIITASHNEPYWNGFKFLDKDGMVLNAKDMEKVIENYTNIKKLDDETFLSKHIYKNENKKITKKVYKKYNEINNAYANYVLNFLTEEDKANIKNSKLKIIIDPNGGTGIIAKQILEKLGVKVYGVNMKHGIFNHVVEPGEDSLLYLMNQVKSKKYDFAAGFSLSIGSPTKSAFKENFLPFSSIFTLDSLNKKESLSFRNNISERKSYNKSSTLSEFSFIDFFSFSSIFFRSAVSSNIAKAAFSNNSFRSLP